MMYVRGSRHDYDRYHIKATTTGKHLCETLCRRKNIGCLGCTTQNLPPKDKGMCMRGFQNSKWSSLDPESLSGGMAKIAAYDLWALYQSPVQ